MLRGIFFTILCLEGPSYLANQVHPILDLSFLLGHRLALRGPHVLQGGCSRTEGTTNRWETACLTNRWKRPKGPEQKILLPLRDKTGSPIKMPFAPGCKDCTQPPTTHSFPLPPFACFSGPHRLMNSSCIHSPDTYPSAVCFQPCRPDRKVEFWPWLRCCSDKGHGNTFS